MFSINLLIIVFFSFKNNCASSEIFPASGVSLLRDLKGANLLSIFANAAFNGLIS
jgi:hypothetical protein